MPPGGCSKADPQFSLFQADSPLNICSLPARSAFLFSAPLNTLPFQSSFCLSIKLADHRNQGTGNDGIRIIDCIVCSIKDEAISANSQKKAACILSCLTEPVIQPCRQPAPEPDPIPKNRYSGTYGENRCGSESVYAKELSALSRKATPPYAQTLSPPYVSKTDLVVGLHICK